MRYRTYLRLTVTGKNNRQAPKDNDGPSAGPRTRPFEVTSYLHNDPKVKRMNTGQPMELRLWDYIDGHCSPTERSAIDELLATNLEWQQKHRELLNIQQLLNGSGLEAPSMRFTKNVMEEISRYHVAPATKSYINKNVIRGIGAFFATMILGMLIFMVSNFKWTSSGPGGDNLNQSIEKGVNRLDSFNYSKLFNNTYLSAFMLIVIIAGLMLLDMYLQQKKRSRPV